MYFGIDYGSKLAGTTSICFSENSLLYVFQSQKKQDGNKFIHYWIKLKKPELAFIDAPLSLPGIYTGEGTDYFYRKCDLEVKGMSPMFIGGLTARAIKLKNELTLYNCRLIECYPRQLVNVLFGKKAPDYGKKWGIDKFLKILNTKIPFPFSDMISSWHMIDAVLAWLTGYRYNNNYALKYGEEREGLIYV